MRIYTRNSLAALSVAASLLAATAARADVGFSAA